MASTVQTGPLDNALTETVNKEKILVVGAGGIGCELLKNLVLTGFHEIHVIDLDTIDVSNLNRQFLFRKEHVGKSKAQIAKESALKFNPDAQINAYHDNIFSTEYGVNFFKQFKVVMNALDNRAARNHVNRMCLAADVPLIESGTAGYLGQVTVIKKGVTECYECQPKPRQKTFPGCTIRNTPSEPIHCIVWAKHLFNQLFGEDDPDQDVSPDTADPEAAGDAGEAALENTGEETEAGGVSRKSTRVWAMEHGYDAEKIFNKLFRDDIKYLLSMHNLWKKRTPPRPLDLDNLHKLDQNEKSQSSTESSGAPSSGGIQDQRIWSLEECYKFLARSLNTLKKQLKERGENGMLVWDKDDEAAMDFVTCASNLRSFAFHIQQKSRFDIKSMAGNIIPAIATTNAIIAGVLVMEGLKILSGNIEQCKTVYLNRHANPRKKLLIPCVLDKPNPKCYVCSLKPEVAIKLNTTTTTVHTLQEKILKGALGMAAPDVEIDDGKGTILISSEEGETEENEGKMLSTFGIQNGSILKCDDFLQVYEVNVNIIHVDKLEEEEEFELIGDIEKVKAENKANDEAGTIDGQQETNQSETAADEEDDMVIVEPEVSKKRKLSADGDDLIQAKKAKADTEEDDGVICL